MIVDRNSFAYRAGRLAGKVLLIGLVYLLGKRGLGKNPLDEFSRRK
jgi:hypothetical protein